MSLAPYAQFNLSRAPQIRHLRAKSDIGSLQNRHMLSLRRKYLKSYPQGINFAHFAPRALANLHLKG
jgi:hypothetical protein